MGYPKKRCGWFVVIYTTDPESKVLSSVFFSRERARAFARKLQDQPEVQAVGTYRIGERLGSYLRNGTPTDAQIRNYLLTGMYGPTI